MATLCDFLKKNYWILVSSLAFSLIYVDSVELHYQSYIYPKEPLQMVFQVRILLPWLLRKIFPVYLIDKSLARIIIAFISTSSIFLLIPKYCQRLGFKNYQLCISTTFLILIAHYCIARHLNVYYVYDLPSICFYLICFLFLTDKRKKVFWIGILFVLLFSTNRETIVVSIFHSAAFLISTQPYKDIYKNLLSLFMSFLGIIFIRFLLMKALKTNIEQSISIVCDDKIRFLCNLLEFKHKRAICQVFNFGFGFIFWIIPALKSMNKLEKNLLLSSIFPFICFLAAGNFLELRIYNELIPLMAVLFAGFITNFNQAISKTY